MIKLTDRLVAYAVKQGLDAELAKDATANESKIVAFIEKSIDEGKMKYGEVKSLSSEERSKGEELIEKSIGNAMAPFASALEQLTKQLASQGAGSDGAAEPNTEKAHSTTETPDKNLTGSGAKAYADAAKNGAGVNDDASVRVKSIKEEFSHTKHFVGKQTKSMQVPMDESGVSRTFDGASDLDRAVAGATMKWLMTRAEIRGEGRCPQWAKMTQLDRKLMEYAAHEMPWVGPVGMRGSDDESCDYGWAKGMRLTDIQTKAVLDDATSGGLEAVPIIFDDLAVLTPLLVGQLLPLVDQRVTTRRRVEGFRLSNPEMYWTAEGTTPTEFSTAGFIGEFNTNIHPCVGWMEIGLDFEADSPVQIADLIVSRYALQAAKKLEDAIASGSGTGQPLGLVNTPSAIAVASANGTTGPLTVSDFESLYFAVPKEFRDESGGRLTFVSNDQTYRRSRGIEVGPTDQRRVFGMDHASYELMDRPYRVNGGLGNSVLLAACMNRYVLYRRAGFEVRRVTEDATLAKQNKELLVVRMRYGGQMNHGNAIALMSDAQS